MMTRDDCKSLSVSLIQSFIFVVMNVAIAQFDPTHILIFGLFTFHYLFITSYLPCHFTYFK